MVEARCRTNGRLSMLLRLLRLQQHAGRAHLEQQLSRSREEIGGPVGPETYVLTRPPGSSPKHVAANEELIIRTRGATET